MDSDRIVVVDNAAILRRERCACLVGERPFVDGLLAAAASCRQREEENRRGAGNTSSTAKSRNTHEVKGSHATASNRDGDYADEMEVAGTTEHSFEQRIRMLEEQSLSALAVHSFETRGRAEPEAPCGVRTPFQRDRDRLVHSKPFRRLKGKTQVFIDPQGDHYRTRMTHTLETTAISRVVARALRLNEDLVEAIGLGHDTGHTPFGHAGEQALDDALTTAFGRRFRHNEQSWRIACRLNLTHEVCSGILTHTGDQEPETLEGKIVRIVDRVAYINHDIDDAIRYGILSDADLPRAEIDLLGRNGSERIDRLVHDLVTASERAGDIQQSVAIGEAMLSLRAFMFDRVYLGPQVGPEHQRARDVVQAIFALLVSDPERLPVGEGELAERITDYVSGMTDRFALAYVGGH
jgi:dGTPase